MNSSHFTDRVVDCVGWMLVHSLWQISIVVILLMLVEHLTPRASASTRYRQLCIGLLLIASMCTGTLALSVGSAPLVTANNELIPDTTAQAASLDLSERNGEITNETTEDSLELRRSTADLDSIASAASGSPLPPQETIVEPPLVHHEQGRFRSNLPWIVAIWACGVVGFSFRTCLGLLGARRLRRRGLSPPSQALSQVIERIHASGFPTSGVRFFESMLAPMPMVIGFARPVILIPAQMLSGITPTQLEGILLHELAHVRRNDFLINLLQAVLENLLFYHPGFWWLSRRIRVERENCCDDAALRQLGNRLAYAKALLLLAESRNPQVSLTLSASGGQLLPRINRILGRSNPSTPFQHPAPALCCLGLMTVFASLFSWQNTVTGLANEPDKPVIATAPADPATNWSMLGGSPSRNNVAPTANVPTAFDVSSNSAIRWTAELGSATYGSPVVADGKVLIGTNNSLGRIARYPAKVDLACLMCFDQQTGEFLWQYSSEKLPSGRAHDWPMIGLCATPCVVGDRVWTTTNRGEVVCLDLEGFADGENDGPVTDEIVGNQEADVVWRLDMMSELQVSPEYQSCSSPVVVGDLVLVNTSNGMHEDGTSLPQPDAPAFLALNRFDGRVVWQDASPGINLLGSSCPSASPAIATINGRQQAIFAGGDGWVYSFDIQQMQRGITKLVWKFDPNPKRSRYNLGGSGMRGVVIGAPVVFADRVYLAIGRNPDHGEGQGILWCIDPSRSGDISAELVFSADSPNQPIAHKKMQACVEKDGDFTRPNPNSGVVFKYEGFDRNGDGHRDFEEEFHRTCSLPVIHNGFLVCVDYSGLVHCIDATTGKQHWTHDLYAAAWATPLICDNKIVVGDEDGDVTLMTLAADFELISEQQIDHPLYSTPCAIDDTMFIGTAARLLAVTEESPVNSSSTSQPASRAR